MNALNILNSNKGFLMEAYNMQGLVGVLLVVAIVDIILKGFALWRAAKLGKTYWFVGLLIINSAGILPAIFLLLTNTEYKKKTTTV